MKIQAKTADAQGIRFSIVEEEQEIARTYLYIMHNDLHQEPFGLLEDVYVNERERGRGIGTKLVQQVIEAAQEKGCYKLIATSRKSRPKVHQLYKKLGFQDTVGEFIKLPIFRCSR